MQDAPIPVYESCRLVGLELEYDSGSMEFRSPPSIPNWENKYDGSLRNGREFVLEPAQPYNELMPHVKAFTDAFDQIKIGLTSRGGYHVHVQVADYSHEHAYQLAWIYTHFQEVIDQLLAKSRKNNHFCPPYNLSELSTNSLVEEFQLCSSAQDRSRAKRSRNYRTINFAMLRCENPSHRSVEFRQGSPSKRFSNIYGWATLMVALTEMAKDPTTWALATQLSSDLGGFLSLVKHWEHNTSSKNLAQWVEWRHKIMNQDPTDDMVRSLSSFLLSDGPQGLFSISTRLNINYPTALKLLESATRSHQIERVGSRYCLARSQEDIARDDMAQLRQAAMARENVQ